MCLSGECAPPRAATPSCLSELSQGRLMVPGGRCVPVMTGPVVGSPPRLLMGRALAVCTPELLPLRARALCLLLHRLRGSATVPRRLCFAYVPRFPSTPPFLLLRRIHQLCEEVVCSRMLGPLFRR